MGAVRCYGSTLSIISRKLLFVISINLSPANRLISRAVLCPRASTTISFFETNSPEAPSTCAK